MSDLPLVSIVVPACNQGEYLAATIESVLAQDYDALEFIVIDDGSTDLTLETARRYELAHPGRLTVLTHENRGQAASLNRGWALARGTILGYLSSDDLLCPTAVSELVAALEAHPQAALAYCDMWLIDTQGRRLRVSHAEDYDRKRLREHLVCQPGVGALFRREVFDVSGGWHEGLHQVPDFEFWLRVARLGDFVRLPRVLGEYRIHDGSASFKAMSVARATEIVGVAQRDQGLAAATAGPDAPSSARIAMSHAWSIAAKNHAQSGRPVEAMRCFVVALRQWPRLALEAGVWRRLLVGFLRRAYYGARERLAVLRRREQHQT